MHRSPNTLRDLRTPRRPAGAPAYFRGYTAETWMRALTPARPLD